METGSLNRLIAESGAESVFVAVHDLETNRNIFIDPDGKYHPASTIKVAVMMEVFKQARSGRFRLEDRIPFTNASKSIADGSTFSVGRKDDADALLHDKIGQSESVRELVRRMIVRSSNLATNILVDLVGAKSITDSVRKMGAGGMQVVRGVEDTKAFERGLSNSATARSLMLLLRRIVEGKAGTRADSAEMARILEGQEFNEGIPAGLPAGVRVAHKTGWVTGIYHDAAIVFPAGHRPYVIVVMTRGIADLKQAQRLVADITRWTYEWVMVQQSIGRPEDG